MNKLVRIESIEKVIGYSFKSKEYPILAFTHSSYANENGCQSNERIEFLGDSILNFVVAETLYAGSGKNEGKLSLTRSNIVSEAPLADAVRRLGLDKYLLTGRSLSRLTDAIRADLFESIVGAIYLDGGMEEARRFVLSTLDSVISSSKSDRLDYKSTLYELAQDKKFKVEFKEISHSGPDHALTFCYAVLVDGTELGRASANSIKQAQTGASKIALEKLRSK